jgi:adenylate cyclase
VFDRPAAGRAIFEQVIRDHLDIVMERATRGGLVVSQTTLERISDQDFDALNISAKRTHKLVFGGKSEGVHAHLSMYRVRWRRQAADDEDEAVTHA